MDQSESFLPRLKTMVERYRTTVAQPHERLALLAWQIAQGHRLEPADRFFQSAAREAIEETGVSGLALHPWHRQHDLPLVIDTHEVPGKPSRQEPDHLHHDLQYLFLADPALPLRHQPDEVHAAQWKPVLELTAISPRALARLRQMD